MKIEVPKTCETLHYNSFCDVGSVYISKKNPVFVIENMFVTRRREKELIRCLSCGRKAFIKKEIELIGMKCFYGHQCLRAIHFEEGSMTRQIGSEAFFGTRLETLEIPAKCELISGSCLKDVKLITISPRNPFYVVEENLLVSADGKRVVIGKTASCVIKRKVEVIGEYCFFGLKTFREIAFDSDSRLRRIEDLAFSKSSLEMIRFPASVETIGENCFCECGFLSKVTFERDCRLKEIPRYAFSRTVLKEIVIPCNVEVIRDYAFASCGCLREVMFEHGSRLRRIGSCAFQQGGLEVITIPSGVEYIGDCCFSGCKRGLRIDCESQDPMIRQYLANPGLR
jgi:hypothetical protein